MENTTDSLIHNPNETKQEYELVELNRKIQHWRCKENEAKIYLCERLREKAALLHQMKNITN